MAEDERRQEAFSRFLFRATGPVKAPGPDDREMLENLRGELERVSALAELLHYGEANPVPPGASELLRDAWERASWILDLWARNKGLEAGDGPERA